MKGQRSLGMVRIRNFLVWRDDAAATTSFNPLIPVLVGTSELGVGLVDLLELRFPREYNILP